MLLLENQGKLAVLQAEVVRFLQSNGCHPYGLIHDSTLFLYHDGEIRFELQMTLLVEDK